MFLTCLAVVGAVSLPCAASELSDAMAQVRKLAAMGKYDESVALLETTLGSVIGDPDVATAEQLLVDCYLKWLDQAEKRKSLPEQAKALSRALLKAPTIAKDLEAKAKLLAVLQDWEAECTKKKDLSEPLRLSAQLQPLKDADFTKLHTRLLIGQVGLLSTGQAEPFLAALIDYQVRQKGAEADIAPDVRKKAAEAMTRQARSIMAQQPERAWQLCVLARKWAGAELPKDLTPAQDKLALQIASWYVGLHDPNRATDWYLRAMDSNDSRTVEEGRKGVKQMETQTVGNAKAAVFPTTIDKDARVKALPVPYVIDGTVTIENCTVTLEPGVHIFGGRLDCKSAKVVAQGTADNPIVFQGVEFHSTTLSDFNLTGSHCAMVRCKNVHEGGNRYTEHRTALTDSYLLHVAELHIFHWYPFDLKNCTLRYGRFYGTNCKYRTLEALALDHCQVNGILLMSIQKGNLTDCSYFDDKDLPDTSINLQMSLSQDGIWLDPASQSILAKWPAAARYSKDSKGKVAFTPAAQPAPRCGASWPCPTFKSSAELAGGFD
jgi:tetratricopeptide (TPR) repeat protein